MLQRYPYKRRLFQDNRTRQDLISNGDITSNLKQWNYH